MSTFQDSLRFFYSDSNFFFCLCAHIYFYFQFHNRNIKYTRIHFFFVSVTVNHIQSFSINILHTVVYISALKCKYVITQYFSVTLVHYSNQYLLIRLCISQNNSDKQHHTIDYLQKPVTYTKSSVHCSQTSDVDAPVDRPKIGTGRFVRSIFLLKCARSASYQHNTTYTNDHT